jgi:uncharacterized repeat protein (TIGR01451 family)
MKFLNYLKKKAKIVLGFATLAAIVSQMLLPAISAKADGPRFNFLEGDLPLIQGANTTAGQNDWSNPVSGIAGDEFRGLIYYHNGMLNTTATNVTVNISIPDQTVDGKAIIDAAISADNADAITSTVVNGKIVGSNGLLVNFPENVNLSFIPGSVRWFPNSNQNGGPNEAPVTLPSGQSGNEIVSHQGLNIGDINGCWPYAGFITFGFKAHEKAAPSIALEKSVRNISAGETSFIKKTNALVGDQVEFNVKVRNTGNTRLEDAHVIDNLPAGLNYVPGSLIKIVDGNKTQLSDADAAKLFVGDGLDIGPCELNSNVSFRFITTVKSGTEQTNLVNEAIVNSEGLTASDTAAVCVEKILTPNLILNKTVRDVTTNEQNFVKSNQAFSGDILEYQIAFSNTGNGPADQVLISDTLPANTQYVAGTTVISRDGGNFQTLPDGITAGGIKLDTVAPGESDVIEFRVLTATGLANGSILCNTAFVNDLQSKAQTTIIVVPTKPVTPASTLPKTGATTDAASFLITFMGAVGVYYIKYRKFMGTEEVTIINSLLSR